MDDKPLRILTVANVPPDPNSGAAGTVWHTNVALRELGHEVDEIWADDLGPRRIAHGNLHSLLEQPRQMRTAIKKTIAERPFDVIISHQPQSYLAAKYCFEANFDGHFYVASQGVEARIAPILAEWHRRLAVPRSRFPRSLLTPALERLLSSNQWTQVCRWSDGVIVVNQEDRDYVVQKLNVSDTNVFVWPSGLSDEFLDPDPPCMTRQRLNNLLYIGQFAFYKAPLILVKIIDRLLRSRPQLRMTWVCHEQHHGAVRSMLDADIQPRITLLSWMPFGDLLTVFDSHGMFLFPTIVEGFGRAALEAMSRGLCVVASDSSGMRDYIDHGVNGALCEVGNVDAFVSETEWLLSHEVEARRISESAVKSARRFTWDAVASDLEGFLFSSRDRTAQSSNEQLSSFVTGKPLGSAT